MICVGWARQEPFHHSPVSCVCNPSPRVRQTRGGVASAVQHRLVEKFLQRQFSLERPSLKLLPFPFYFPSAGKMEWWLCLSLIDQHSHLSSGEALERHLGGSLRPPRSWCWYFQACFPDHGVNMRSLGLFHEREQLASAEAAFSVIERILFVSTHTLLIQFIVLLGWRMSKTLA